MIRPSVQKIIHGKAFDKVCEVLNRVLHVRRTDWDLCIPVVVWAYRTMYRTLTVQALPKLKYEEGVVIPMEHAKPSLCIASPIDMIVREA